MRVSIHTSIVERGPATARSWNDAEHIASHFLSARVDAEVVEGSVGAARGSSFWFVFEADLPWHLDQLGQAPRERLVVLRPSGAQPFALIDNVAAIVTYDDVAEWTAPAKPGALLVRGNTPLGSSLIEQLIASLRAQSGEQAVAGSLAEFPLGQTIDRGAFRIERHLQGGGFQQLYLARDRSGGELLISYDYQSRIDDMRGFLKSLSYESPGVFPLAYVGKLDFAANADLSELTSRWVLVERASSGSWLPSFFPPVPLEDLARSESVQRKIDRRAALADALGLGRSAGRIIAAAAARGTLLLRTRPEYMWAHRVDGVLEVSGLSARGAAFFATTRVDAVSDRLFDRHYDAPEADDSDVDERALVFSLAIMIAEWATGRYPYKYKYHERGAMTGKHLKLDVPKPLAQLLSSGMAVDRDKRPSLDEFVAGLV